MRVLVFIVLSVISGPYAAWADVPALMGKLSADDPTSRDQAGRDLLTAGPSARPALVEALRSADPELRLRAGRLLLQMPWTSPDDPPAVRDILADYGQPEINQRMRKIAALANLPELAGIPALLRLLAEDPADSVRWRIGGFLRTVQSCKIWNRLRSMEPAGLRAPQIAAIGWAWTHYDPRRSIQLMRQAIAEDESRPENSSGEMELLLRYLIDQERLAGNFDQVARLLRRGMIRGGQEVQAQWAFELLALHVERGSLEGFDQDRPICENLLSPALRLYIAGKLDQRQGNADAAKRKFQQAMESSQTPAEHLRTGDALLQQNWDEPAERELNRVLENPGKPDGYLLANAHFRLARIVDHRKDDFQTAEHLRLGLEATGQTRGAVLTRQGGHADESAESAASAIWAQVYWHYYRAAAAGGDAAEAEKYLAKLLASHDNNGEIVMDLMPKLSASGHKEEAMQLFESAYKPARALLDADPENPELLNNLAWLCARSGQNLPEALEAARRATAIAPHHPAYLDTQAEAEYRNGHPEAAIALEKQALEQRPRDSFMQKQLQRFEAGLP